MDQTIDAQPFLGQLVADPSARGLFSALSLLGMGVTQGDADLSPYLRADQAASTRRWPMRWTATRSRCPGKRCWAAA